MKAILSKPLLFCCAAAVSMSLTSCMYAPGSYLKNEPQQTDYDNLVDILTITPELLSVENTQELLLRANSEAESNSSNTFYDYAEDYDYRIGKGDVLTIVVYEHPELTIPAGGDRSAEEAGNIVYSDGTIFYPYIGMVEVMGQTSKEVRDEIQERLAEFLTDPQIDVKVISFRSQKAYVTGQVNKPGSLPITDVPLTVLDAITQASGLTDIANWHEVQLTRNGAEEVELSIFEMLNNGKLDENYLLNHGDVLHIPDLGDHKVFMMGEVGTVSSLNMGSISYSLTDAIAQSGGIDNFTAEAEGVFVIRQAPQESDKLATVYQLDVSNPIAFAIGAQFILKPEDVVYVTTAPVARWNRVISQILPSITALYRIDDLNAL